MEQERIIKGIGIVEALELMAKFEREAKANGMEPFVDGLSDEELASYALAVKNVLRVEGIVERILVIKLFQRGLQLAPRGTPADV